MQSYVLGRPTANTCFNCSGEIVIKVDPTRSSHDLSLGTQLMPLGVGVPRHVHAYWDEVIYVLDGSGFITLNDEQATDPEGRDDLRPEGERGMGFENPDAELFVLWMANSPGQAEFFRAISSRPSEPAKNLSREASAGDPPAGRSRPSEAGSIRVLMCRGGVYSIRTTTAP